MSILKELCVKRPYYCSESNYYSNTPNEQYPTATDFLDDFEGMDPDLNLCFRWDVKEILDEETEEPTGEYRAEVFLMLQRKGIFKPCMIELIAEHEAERFKAYIERHMKVMQAIWAPLWKESAE